MNLTICTILTAVIAFAEGAETADLTVVNGHSNVVASGVEDEDAEVKVADTPEFLKLATDSQRKEYIELEANMNVPVGATRKAQDLWAKKIGEPVLSAYEKHVAAEDAAKASETARMDRAVAKLSQAARTADQFIRGIYSNDSLTRKQINAEVTRQMKLLPKKVYNELTLAIQ
ncbi:unnamed protein product [Heligmosomoides polygyrus]|uniref:DUF148 domain-containing protein n=1 Tax=Heligmosomoides polygyrus TaxID=6339 RepID=A0A183G5S1_HELPZ|nr:unnamed protein product [Heligmosomoides polygyrus]